MYCRQRAVVLAAIGVLLVTDGGASADLLSAKRGYADTGGNYSGLQATNAGWYHTWDPQLGNPGNFDALQIPMFRWWTDIPGTINWILNRPEPVEWVMGFNEPERGDQDNLTVSEAISRWTQISNGFAGTGIKLVTPAVSDTSAGKAWMTDFKNQVVANGLQVDAVAFHWYGWSSPDNIAQAFANFQGGVNWYHNLWNKPVFISEFAIHDWGGAYTDEEIIEANRQFLDLAIPWLESTSWVEGYAWYTWFGDAHLFEGDPATPTPMGYKYIGVIQSGETYDFSGADHGEHVAYLAGGQLTHGSGAAGTLRYISALEKTSRLTGTANWGLVYEDWVRVQPGATLRKGGTNVVTLDGADVTNNGVIDVAEGELAMDGRYLGGAGTIRVREGATLRLDSTIGGRGSPGNFRHQIELDGGTVAAPATPGIVGAASDAVLSGDGVVAGGLTAYAGSTIRVGGSGLSSSSWSTIDDFESYTTGKLNAGATGGVWTGVFDGTANAQVVSDSGNNSLEYYGTGSS